MLSEVGFSDRISTEDENPHGDEGFAKSLTLLRSQIDEYWQL